MTYEEALHKLAPAGQEHLLQYYEEINEEQKKFHVKVWIFTYGIACLLATRTVKFTDEEIEELLVSTVDAMLKSK